MNWTLNTTGPCKLEALADNLKAEMSHFLATQEEAYLRERVPDYFATGDDVSRPDRQEIFKKHVEEARVPLREAYRAKLPRIQAQMSAAIDGAIANAKALASGDAAALFQVTLIGHDEPDHPVAGQRVVISIDRVD